MNWLRNHRDLYSQILILLGRRPLTARHCDPEAAKAICAREPSLHQQSSEISASKAWRKSRQCLGKWASETLLGGSCVGLQVQWGGGSDNLNLIPMDHEVAEGLLEQTFRVGSSCGSR